ncbi:MAG: DUF4347 domain-containing protein [Cyclobacteriaceae bacterium]
MHSKLANKIGTACLHMALSASSLALMGTPSSYYRTRRGGYGCNNKQYLAETGLTPLSTTTFRNTDCQHNEGNGNMGNDSQEFHFEKGRRVKELLIVDGAVQNKSVFLNQVKPGLEVVEIKDANGIVSLLEVLSNYQGLDAVHIVSHAKAGAMQLGGQVVNAASFEDNLSELVKLNRAIRPGGDLMLYGCELAKGREGENFLEILKNNTHADIAASVDKTGNEAFGGDWDLEITKGDIEATPLPESIAMKDFTGVLQYTGVIQFDQINYAGDYTGAATVDASVYTSGGLEYILVADGTIGGTGTYYVPGVNEDGIYSFNGESNVRLHFSNNETFDVNGTNSIYVWNVSGAATTFTFTGDNGVMGTSGSIANTDGAYVSLGANNTGITYVDITGSGAFYAHFSLFNVANVTPANNAPTISIDNSTLAFTEDDGPSQIDAAGTVSDADGDADWDGGTLTVQITANNEATDEISIPDNIVGTINTNGTDLRNGATVIGALSANEGTVTNGTTLTITFNSNATNALVQQTLRAISYQSTSNTPGTMNRTVTFTATDVNADSNNDTRTISVTALDPPSITTNAATSVGISSATLNGDITSDGGTAITQRGFVYALTATDPTPTVAEQNGSTVIQVIEGGTATGAFSSAIGSLAASSNYSFIAYAINAEGTTEGNTLTFMTSANTPPTDNGGDEAITLDEGATANITTSDLEYTDAEQAASAVTFTIRALEGVANGTLFIDNDNSDDFNAGDTDVSAAASTFTQADIIAGNLWYEHDGGETSSDIFGFDVSDGAGGFVLDLDFNITVTPQNDDPSDAGALPASITVTEDVAGNVNISSINIFDPDNGGAANNDVILTATDGDFTSTNGGGVTVSGSPGSTITLQGTIANLNTFLNTASNITYQGPSNAFGNNEESFTVEVDDNGNSGAGGGAPVTFGTVQINISAVNDEPIPTLIGGPDQAANSSDVITVADMIDIVASIDFGASSTETDNVQSYSLSADVPALFTSQPTITPAAALNDPTTDYLAYDPAPHADGTATVTLLVVDDGGIALGGVNTTQAGNAVTFDIVITDDEDPVVNALNSPPVVTNVQETQFDLNVNITDRANAVTIHWKTRETSDPDITTAADVKSAVSGDDVSMGMFSYVGPDTDESGVIDGLVGLTDYEVFWIAEDDNGNQSAVQTASTTTTDDVTPPVISGATDNNTLQTSTEIRLTVDESSTIFYVFLPDGTDGTANEPDLNDVQNGVDGMGAAAIKSGSYSQSTGSKDELINFLPDNTAFDLYVVAVDAKGNDSNPTLIEFSTLAIDNATGVSITAPSLQLCIGDENWELLGPIVIDEDANGDFSNQGEESFILTLPQGFEFRTIANGASVTVSETGSDDFNSGWPKLISISSTAITIEFKIDGTGADDDVTITGLELKATSGAQAGTLQRIVGAGGTQTVNGGDAGNGRSYANLTVGTELTPPADNSYEICDGNGFDVSIFGAGENETDWLWYADEAETMLVHDGETDGPLDNADLIANAELNLDAIVAPGSATFYVKAAGAGGCPSVSAEITFNINAKPGADAGDDFTICAGEQITIGGSPTLSGPTVAGSYIYNWTLNDDSAIPMDQTTIRYTGRSGSGFVVGQTVTEAVSGVTGDVVAVEVLSPTTVGRLTLNNLSGQLIGGQTLDNSAGTTATGAVYPGANPKLIPTGENTAYTYKLLITDPNGCISDPSTMAVTIHPENIVTLALVPDQPNYDINFGDVVLDANPVPPNPLTSDYIFTGTAITYDMDADPDQTAPFSGAYVFNTQDAGIDDHVVSYSFIDGNGCIATAVTTISVVANTDFDGLPADICREDGDIFITPSIDLIDQIDAFDFNDGEFDYDYEFEEVRYAQKIILLQDNGLSITGSNGSRVVSGDLTFDPDLALTQNGNIETSNRLFIYVNERRTDVNPGNGTTPTTNNLLGFKTSSIGVYNVPTVTISNLNSHHCTDETGFALQAVVGGENAASGTYSIGDAMAGPFDNRTGLDAAGNIIFDADGATGGITGLVAGTYYIQYVSAPSDDPNSNNPTGCSVTSVFEFTAVDRPTAPILSAKTYQSQPNVLTNLEFSGGEYTWVYCEDEFIRSFYMDFIDVASPFGTQDNPDNTKVFFTWYNNALLREQDKVTISGFGADDARFVDRSDFFPNDVTPSAGTYEFWVTQSSGRTAFPAGDIFTGCESAARKFTFEIIGDPANHDVTSAPFEQINDVWIAEYCVADPIDDIDLAATPALLVTPGVDAFVWTDDDGDEIITGSNTITAIDLGVGNGTPGFGTATPPASPPIDVTTVNYDNLSGFSFSQGEEVTIAQYGLVEFTYDAAINFQVGEIVETCCSEFVVVSLTPTQMEVMSMTSTDWVNGDPMEGRTSGATATMGNTGPNATIDATATVSSDDLATMKLINVSSTPLTDGYYLFPEFSRSAGQITSSSTATEAVPYTYTFRRRDQIGFITQDASEGDFAGCDGTSQEVNIVVYAEPGAPAADNLFDTEIYACVGDIALADDLLSPVGNNPDVEYVWYDAMTMGTEIGRDDITYDDLDDVVTSFDPDNVSDTDGEDVYSVWVSQITNGKNSLTAGFNGCESSARTEVRIHIFEDPELDQAIFTARDASNTLLTRRVDDGVTDNIPAGSGDVQFTVCAGEISSSYTFTAPNADANDGANVTYEWFESNSSGDEGVSRSTSQTATAGELQLVGAGAGNPFYLVRKTSNIITNEFVGCESNDVLVRIQIESIPNAPTGTVAYSYCEGDNPDTPGLGISVAVGAGSEARWYTSASNYINNIVQYTGTTPTAANLGLDNTTVGGTYRYFVSQVASIDNNPEANPVFAGCETAFASTLQVEVTVNALPTPQLFTPGGQTEFCIATTDGSANIITLNGSPTTPAGTFSSVNITPADAGLTPTGNGVATLNLVQAFAAIQTEAAQDLTDRQGEYTVRYTYTNANGCTDFAEQTLFINQLPEPSFNVQRGNDDSNILTATPGAVIVVCEEDLSVEGGAIADRIVLKNTTNATTYGALTDATFLGRITTAGINQNFNSDDVAFFENLDAGNDGANDGEAYFYPGVAIQAANSVGALAVANPLRYEFRLLYTNDDGCLGRTQEAERIFIDVYKTPVPTITISSGQTTTNAAKFCSDDDGPITFNTGTITFESGGSHVVNSTPALSADALSITGSEATLVPSIAFQEATTNGDTDGFTPVDFDISYTYTTVQGCEAETNTYTVTVNPVPQIDYTFTPKNVDIGFFAPNEFCQDHGVVQLNGFGFFGESVTEDNRATLVNTSFTSNKGNAGISNSGSGTASFDVTSAFDQAGGGVHTITFAFTDDEGCANSISKDFIINRKPTVVITSTGGCNEEATTISVEVTDLAEGDAVDFVEWDFEGTEGFFAEETTKELFIEHAYPSPGTKNLRVKVHTIKDCESDIVSSSFFVGEIPTTNFTYDGLCGDADFIFTALPEEVDSEVVDSYTFDFGDGSDEITVIVPDNAVDDDFKINHRFPTAGVYSVTLTVITNNGCINSHSRLVPVLPTIVVTPTNPYIETFEGIAEILEVEIGTDENGNPIIDTLFVDGWVPDLRSLDNKSGFTEDSLVDVARDRFNNNTWQFGAVGGEVISTGANNSEKAWLTNLNGDFAINENSWVFTPCFDISALEQPMVRFQRFMDFKDRRDGAVFQYSINNGATWHVLGDFVQGSETGINWYTAEGLLGDPGNQIAFEADPNFIGWGSEITDEDWVEARHKLDEIPIGGDVRRRVIFRFGIGAASGENAQSEGFGIDDFIIEDRSSKVLIEHFSGSLNGNPSLTRVIDELDELRLEKTIIPLDEEEKKVNNNDGIFITYKTDLEGADNINLSNPSDNNARVVFYGVEALPTTVLNGEGGSNTNSQNQSNLPFTENDFNKAALREPALTMSIELPTAAGDQLAVTVNMVRNFVDEQDPSYIDLTDENYRLYLAVVEKEVDDSGVQLSNVLRKLLPSGSGSALLTDGNTIQSVSHTWRIQRVQNADNLMVMAWVQHNETKEVVQAAAVDVGDKDDNIVTSIDELILDSEAVNIYPNPAKDYVQIDFDYQLDEEFSFALYNQIGAYTRAGILKRGTESFSINTAELPSGMYFLFISNDTKKYEHFKIIVKH